MRRAPLLALLVAMLAGCGGSSTPLPSTNAATLQRAALGWSERAGTKAAGIVFRVRSFEVRAGGWEAAVSVTNDTSVGFRLGPTPRLQYGLMLFRTGEHGELDRRLANGSLPAIRHAERYVPELSERLGPGKTWAGTISAPGPLVAGSWIRVVFGPLEPVGATPKSLRDEGVSGPLVWISDHAYQLRP